MRILLAIILAGTASVASTQTCQRIGSQTFCDSGVTAQDIGNSRFYSYPDQDEARRRGLPDSSTRIGNNRFYDNGETSTDIGSTRFYSDGETRQRIGDTDFYSNGTTCQTIGATRICN